MASSSNADHQPDSLTRARQALNSAATQCRNELSKLARLPLSERLNRLEKVFQVVLAGMGAALQNGMGAYVDGPVLYFWPGYNSILTGSRLTLTAEYRGRLISSPWDPYMAGSGPTDTSVWFDALLARGVGRTGRRLQPGSTHRWITQDGIRLSDDSELEVLAVHFGSRPAQHCDVSENGVCSVWLSKDRLTEWGSDLAKRLNDQSFVLQAPEWPHPLERGPTPRGIRTDMVRQIRQELYTFWLMTSCEKDWRNAGDFWIKGLIHRLQSTGIEQYVQLAAKIDSALRHPQDLARNKYFNHWYTFALQKTPVVAKPGSLLPTQESEELGSAMIFSSHELDGRFVFLAKRWMEEIYLWIRYVEATTQIERDGPRLYAASAGHEVSAQLSAYHAFTSEIDPDDRTSLVPLIEATVQYAHLWLSPPKKHGGLYEIQDRECVREWLSRCAVLSRNIAIARECGRVSRDEMKALLTITVHLSTLLPNIRFLVSPNLKYACPSQLDGSRVAWNLHRWVLAALSNAIRWAGKGDAATGGPDLLREWYRHARNGKPWREIVIEVDVTFDRQEPYSTLSIYNEAPEENQGRVSLARRGGTTEALEFIVAALPPSKHTFGKMSKRDLRRLFPRASYGHFARVSLAGQFFRSQ